MAGHSKWAQIKRQKAKTDANRGKIFTKMAREIIVSVKSGGSGDIELNHRLRAAVTRAKAAGVPNDNIERAIQKGLGAAGDSDNFENIQYEGYGPDGVAIIIEALTDNRNRTAGDIRSYFNKCDGNLGETGCVNWMFEKKGVITLGEETDLEALYDVAVEAGAEDIKENSQPLEVHTAPEDLEVVVQALEKNFEIQAYEVTFLPQNILAVSTFESAKKLLKLMDLLEEHDDVQNVYSNFELDDAILEQLS